MITPDTARMLARYRAWSSGVWFDAVAALPPGEATKERKSLFKNMVHTLNHLYVVDLIWQAHLEGREHGLTARNTADHPPLDELREKQEAVDRWYVDWSDRATDATLAEAREVVLVGGNRVTMTRGEMLLHVVNHTAYHRGFVADMFFEVPARPPVTDLPVYLREAGASR